MCKVRGSVAQALSSSSRYGCFTCLSIAGDTGPVYRTPPPAPAMPPTEIGELLDWLL
jgi:hypothetical protein